MARRPELVDQYGRPIDRSQLTVEKSGPSLTSVRSPLTGYPGDGLTPRRLAAILREADAGDPERYLELAETIEERDLHYAGVLGTRRRSVAQLEVTVEAGSDAAEHQAHADMVRRWLLRDELQGELFDILDAVPKGFSVTETIWDTSERSWEPKRLEYRDPRFFTFRLPDLAIPLLRTEAGPEPLTPFGYITCVMRAKSGLPIRSGIARLAAWFWMFKSFANRDWAIFCQTYGQPIRIGKYGKGATEAEKEILYRAVANIAGDCAATIPADMIIEFVESQTVSSSTALYRERCEWLDQSLSKAVLGQTTTTDAISGGHAVSQEHRQVQEDIERADAITVAACLNRDLIRPWIDLEFGPQAVYPRLRIGRREEKDVARIVDAVKSLVPLGLRVETAVMSDVLGLPVPKADAEVLKPAAAPHPPAPSPAAPAEPAPQMTLHAQAGRDAIDTLVAAVVEDGWEPLMRPIVDGLAAELATCETADDARRAIVAHLARMDTGPLADLLARAGFAARLAGLADEPLS